MSARRIDLGRIVLSVLFIGALIGGSLWVLRPFLGAFIWAVMIVVATWPVMKRLQALLWGKRALAVLAMTMVLLAVLIIPLALALSAVFQHFDELAGLPSRLADAHVPPPPDWVASLPVVGERAAAAWTRTTTLGFDDFMRTVEPYLRDAATWVARQAGGFAMVIVQFLLIVILSAILFSTGEAWGVWVRRFGLRLADVQGERMAVLAAQAIRGVAMGVVITALVQATLGGIGLAIAGVPFASVLTAIMFMLCIAQLGPLPVLLGATIWAFSTQGAGWGTFLLVWTVVVGTMDNFLRPFLIKKGADLPLLLIFAGVIGGLIAFGVVGIFVGPVVLAVAYTLLDDWVAGAPADAVALQRK
jgi:predicted PurR-regulated permease PerM